MSPHPGSIFRFLLAAALVLAGPGLPARAQSVLPTGGHVVAGGATIGAPAGAGLTVTQTTPRAVVNWNSFSVGQPNRVTFAQPGTSAAILNRVTGNTPSAIAGQVQGNGQVYLVNPNGIAITPTGNVQVGGGFVGSTLGIANQDFMAGKLRFNGNGASAPATNAGTISAGPGGFAALVGGTAANSGTISVPLGKAALGSGEAATLDINGGGFLQVAAPTGATTAQGQALVSNSGRINAAGGTVELKAATVAGAIRDAVNLQGVVTANSISGQNGSITLGGGAGGAVNVTGTLDASGSGGANGGAITVAGAKVRVGHHAILNASGAKGGSVLVGVTGPNGAGEADATTIADGATILATGGGHIETSGQKLSLGKALIDAGIGGSWLTDPVDLTIDSTAATTINTALAANTSVTEQTTSSGGIMGAGTEAVGNGDINVASALSWSTAATLTLNAFNNVNITAPITVGGSGQLVVTAGNNINVAPQIAVTAGGGLAFTYNSAGANSTATLTFTMGQGSAVFSSEGSHPTLSINASPYTLIYTETELDNLVAAAKSAIAGPLTLTTTYTRAVIPSLSGTLNGLGNTISGLNINDTSTGGIVQDGLIAQLFGGTVANIGVSGTIFAKDAFAGGLAAVMTGGRITNSYAAVNISADPSGVFAVGGLVAENDPGSRISNSYATGSVTGGTGTNTADAGGFIGVNSGTITNSFATGAVSGGNAAGGFLAENGPTGTITTSYSTGVPTTAVGGFLGGFVAVNLGTVTNSYYDSTTSLQPAGNQGNGTIGLATATLGGALPTGFSSTVWGNLGNQTTPYLLTNPGPVFLGSDSSATPASYNLVFTPTQLQAINNNLSGNFLLAQNVDLSSIEAFTPIGGGSPFTGQLDGLGNTISNLTTATVTSGADLGLFAKITGATISNLGIVGGNIGGSGAGTTAGALVGVANSGTITNVYASVSVSGAGGGTFGGLIGLNGATVSDSYATGEVGSTSAANLGGFAGKNTGTITNSYATGSISSTAASNIGGFVGINDGSVSLAYSAGAIIATGGGNIGGFVGQALASSSIGTAYFNQDRAGTATPVGVNAGTGSATGLSSAGLSPFSTSSYGFSFTTTPGIAGDWVIVDVDGSLNNTSGSGATMPMLANEYSTTIVNAHQLQLMVMGLGATYTLGRNVDATTTASSTSASTGTDVWTSTGFVPVGQSTAFTGTLNGAGYTISGLTVNSAKGVAGLFGDLGAGSQASNLGLVGGTVNDTAVNAWVGALAGGNSGQISNSYATTSVNVGDGEFTGGLVGINDGLISQSFAAGSVIAGNGGNTGGLVGQNRNGTISQSFAAGAVTAVSGRVGGLVGETQGTISDAYAIGSVTVAGGGSAGGLVGFNLGPTAIITDAYATGPVSGGAGAQVGGLVGSESGSIIHGYWDIGTTGAPDNGFGAGQLTTTLQGGLQAGFSSPTWGIVAGKSYPYLCWQAGNCGLTPQVVAGVVYSDQGITPAARAEVVGFVNGQHLNSIQTLTFASFGGANGYYYYLLAPNTMSTLANNVATVNIPVSIALADQVTSGAVNNLAIYGDTIHEVTAQASNVTVQNDLVTALGFSPGSLSSNLWIDAATTYTVDSAISQTGRIEITTGTGALTIGADIAPGSTKTLTLKSAGTLAINSGVTIGSNTSTVDLGAAGAVTEDPTAVIEAETLQSTGGVAGNVSLVGTGNTVNGIGPFAVTGGTANEFALVDSFSINVDGAVSASGNIFLKTNNPDGIGIATGSVSVGNGQVASFETRLLAITGSGSVSAGTVEIAPGSGNITIGTGGVLTAAGITAGTIRIGAVTLPGGSSPTTTASGIIVGASGFNVSTATTLDLETTGNISGTGGFPNTAGPLTAATLTGSSADAVLGGNNAIATLGSFASTASFTLNDTVSLIVTGPISAPGGLLLGTSGTAALTINGNITVPGGDIELTSGTTITQNAASVIDPTTMFITASGNVSMPGANVVDQLAARITGSGSSLSFNNTAHDLAVDNVSGEPGIITNNGNVTLSTTNSGNITLNQPIDTTGFPVHVPTTATVALNSAGTVSQDPINGTIIAQTLTGTSVGGATFDNAGNTVLDIGSWSDTGSGSAGFTFSNPADVAVGGTISSISGPITLAAGNIDLSGDLTATAGTVTLTTPGEIIQGVGSITAATLTGSSGADATFGGGNEISTLGSFNSGSSMFDLVNERALTVSGPVSAGSIIIAVQGLSGLTLSGPLNGLTSTELAAEGAIIETSGGTITTPTFTAVTLLDTGAAISLPSASNSITDVTLASLDLALTGAAAGTITFVSSGNVNIHDLGLIVTHGITTTGAASVQAGGTLTEDGTIVAGSFSGSSVGGATLTNTNQVGVFGPFTNTGGSIQFTNGPSLAVAGTVSADSITLTTTGANASLTFGNGGGPADGSLSAPSGVVTLAINGSIAQSSGTITTSGLTGSSVGGASMTGANLVGALSGFTNTGSGDVSFTNAQTLQTGPVTNSVGDLTLATTVGDIILIPSTTLAASPSGTLTLASAGAVSGSGPPGLFPTVSAGSLLVTAAGGNVDLPGANTVGTVAANLTAFEGSFDLSNAQALIVGTAGGVNGITTNQGTVLIQTTVGDLTLNQPINTIGGGTDLTGAFAQVGLSSAGSLSQTSFGPITAAAAELLAGGNISLASNDNAVLNLAAEAMGVGGVVDFVDKADLAISDQLGSGVAAGSMTLPPLAVPAAGGIYANGGEIGIAALASLTLGEPVNANTFVGGAPSAVLQPSPGEVFLAAGGGITESGDGVILGSQLYAASLAGGVTLTADNRIGANDNGAGIAQTSGIVAGVAEGGNFQLVNHNAGITVGALSCGCVGIFTQSGDIDLATTGAGAITVNKPLHSGNEINIAVAPGYAFTNTATNDATFDSEYLPSGATTAGLDTTTSAGSITILADAMTLSGGTIQTGTAGGVVLAPATTTDGIILGNVGSTGVLGLRTADLAGIKAGFVQIGYRNQDGSVALTGDIDLVGNLSVTTANVPELLLVTGGTVGSSASRAIVGGGTLQLGIIAGGEIDLSGSDSVGTLAAYVDGTSPLVEFGNAGSLTVGTLSRPQLGIGIDGNGFPSPVSASNPLSGMTNAAQGAVTGGGIGLTTTAGNITVSAPVSAVDQGVGVSAFGGVAINSTVTAGTFGVLAGGFGPGTVAITEGAGGDLVVSGGAALDNFSTGGTITFGSNNSISGPVTIETTGAGADATVVNGIALTLGASTVGGNLTVSATGGLTVDGTVTSPGTIALNAIAGSGTGPLSVVSGGNLQAPLIDLNATSIALTGNAMLGQAGATIDLAHTTSGGGVTEASGSTIIAISLGATNPLAGNVSLTGAGNAINELTSISATGGGNGIAVTSGSGTMVVAGALSTTNGPVSLTTAGGSMSLTSDISAPGNVVTLSANGSLSQTGGAITAGTLTGSTADGAVLPDANAVTALGAFGNTVIGQISFTDARALTVTGSVSNTGGEITLMTTGAGSNLALQGGLTAAGNTVRLSSAGTVTQTGGIITARTLTGGSVGGATLADGNLVANFGTWNDTAGGVGSTGIQFADGQTMTTTGTIFSAGPVSLSAIFDPDLVLNTDIVSGGVVTLFANGNISQTGGGITGTGLVATTQLNAGGSIALNSTTNAITGNVTLTSLNMGGTLAGGAITFADSGAYTIAAAGGFQTGVATTGPVTLTSGADLTLAAGSAVTGGGVVLAATGNFVNNSGSGAVTATDGNRWLIYSAAPAGDNFGGLDSGNTAIWRASFASLPPEDVAPGNRYLFAQSQTLTVTTTNLAKTYGQDATLAVAGAFTVSGIEAGVAGAFIGDTAATAFSGAPSVTSAGSANTASVADGPYTITATDGTMTALGGYALVFAESGKLTVNPAPLTLTANSATKTYGSTLSFAGTEFSTAGSLFNGDTVTGVSLTSPGAAATAGVAGSPYAILASAATGTGIANYSITYVNGALTVTPAALTVTANNTSKTYGTTLNFAGTEFTTAGSLFNGDSVTGVTLASAGAPGAAGVAGSPYAITASAATGTGVANYTITYVNGALTVTPAALTITANNATKTYGSTLGFAGTEFTTAGLVSGTGDTVTGVSLASLGAPGTAGVAGSPYAITGSAATGSGLANYTVSYVNGALTVTPASLTVTADDLTRGLGQANPALTFTVTAGSLFNGDTLSGDLATTASAASAAGPYPITEGTLTGGANYTLAFDNGTLTVTGSAPTPVAGTPNFGVSPDMFISDNSPDGWLWWLKHVSVGGDTGSGGGLTTCTAGNIGQILKANGQVQLFGNPRTCGSF